MCFSAQADIVGGVVVSAIGVDVLRNVRGRRRHIALAALPLMLGLHQLVEAVVWWGLQGHLSESVGRFAVWLYLLVAFVVLPVFVPVAVMVLEPKGGRRQAMASLVVLGLAVSGVLFAAMIRGPVAATLGDKHIAYSTDLRAGLLVVIAYVIATCGSLLLSSYGDIAIVGIANLLAVAALAKLTIDGFASLWCGWAAVTSGALAIHMRYGRSSPLELASSTTGG